MSKEQDFTKVCWNCGGAMIPAPELGSPRWHRCTKCTATYDEPQIYDETIGLVMVNHGAVGIVASPVKAKGPKKLAPLPRKRKKNDPMQAKF